MRNKCTKQENVLKRGCFSVLANKFLKVTGRIEGRKVKNLKEKDCKDKWVGQKE
jgi:hypothetical protein